MRIYEDHQGHVLGKKKSVEESEKLMKAAESVFLIMNIRLKEITDMISDSSMFIYPIEERRELAAFYQLLVPEVCDFPYAFLVKLKICMITVCGEVDLTHLSFQNVLEQKMNNGLFVLKNLVTQEAVRDYWYRIVTFHFIKANPGMYEEWKLFVQGESIYSPLMRKATNKTYIDEMLMTFKGILRPQDIAGKFEQMQPKIKFLMKHLKSFEAIWSDEEWWDMRYLEMRNGGM